MPLLARSSFTGGATVYLAPGQYILNSTLSMGASAGADDNSGGVLWTTRADSEVRLSKKQHAPYWN